MKKIFDFLGMDSAIIYVVMARGWGVVSGLVTLLLITRFLSLEEQGYYYTFASILALQVIFELGLGTILVQFVSHEMNEVAIENGILIGNGNNIHRIASIVRLSTKWYSAMAILVVIVVIPLGIYYFEGSHASDAGGVSWLFPWVYLVFASSLSFLITPLLAVAEGLGFVTQVANVRFWQTAVSGILAWLALSTGYGLYATAASASALFIVGGYWIILNVYPIIKQSYILGNSKDNFSKGVSWTREILPMQWRVGLSWLCGYFIFQMFNPIAFKMYGAEFAGKLGMSINVVNLMLSLSLAWISTKIPKFGLLISQNRISELDLLFYKSFKSSFAFLSFIVSFSFVVLYAMNYFDVGFAHRFLSPECYLLLCATILGNHIVASQATYVRSHKVERYLPNSMFTALLMVLAFSFIQGKPAVYMLVAYFLVIWVFCVPHSTYLFYNFKKSRHVFC